jgi:hypothetical protein
MFVFMLTGSVLGADQGLSVTGGTLIHCAATYEEMENFASVLSGSNAFFDSLGEKQCAI